MGLKQRLKTGIVLTKESTSVVQEYPQLLLFPIVSGLASLLFIGLLVTPMFGAAAASSAELPTSVLMLGAGVLYLGVAFITAFFAAALVHQTRAAIGGDEPSVRAGLKGAWAVKGPLFVWALISATVGLILDAIQESSESIIGQILSALVGVAWTLLTFFVVPVIVFENPSVRDMFSRSGETFKQTYGETPISLAGTTIIGMLCGSILMLPGLGLLFGVGGTIGFAGIPLAIAGIAVAQLVSTTLRGIVKTALYFYATEGERPDGFEEVFDTLDYEDNAHTGSQGQSQYGFGGVQ